MIYALQPTDGGPVKIGYSHDVDVRRAQLESHYGKPLALLATMPGGREEEAEIHARFSHLRMGRTEQFRPAADLMAFLGRPLLVDANPETVEIMKGRNRPGKPIKLTREAFRSARIASAYTGETMGEYISRIVAEKAREDVIRLYAELTAKTTKRSEGGK